MRDLAFLAAKKRADRAEANLAVVRAALEEVLPQIPHWSRDGLGSGWNQSTEPHSQYCPACSIQNVLVRLGTGEALQAVREAQILADNIRHREPKDIDPETYEALVGHAEGVAARLKAVFGE